VTPVYAFGDEGRSTPGTTVQ